ncbi:aconitate hydratase AcnA [Ottowia thiooxydans]|uniref:aconitate hydratase AcnA n=1 Tax=Ottowia thiooxydans TaxID=219182 RepID=UPI0004126AE0|nr:aconitate hydratase AcnA [Ottowia thiooxydans]
MHLLAALQDQGLGHIERLPVSLRMLLETMLRHCDGIRVLPEHVRALCGWTPTGARTQELPFVPARILLQDLNGVPLIADLAAMRDTAQANGWPASLIEPQVPVDLVVDHSVQVDHQGNKQALALNMSTEFERNAERFMFLKWGERAFRGVNVVAPGIGICHQVNLERLATGVSCTNGIYHPDSVVCPDSHTTMINGLGILGWGVGGIEAEAGMLGQPIFLLTPNVVGVELCGELRPGVTSTDAVLAITERLRKEKVVGDFVEFIGKGAAGLSVPTRATIANMAPEYGAFIGFFPPDEKTLSYYADTGRATEHVQAYLMQQGLLGIPSAEQIDYTRVVRIDLSAVVPSVAGPRRPQDRIELSRLPEGFAAFLQELNPLPAGNRPKGWVESASSSRILPDGAPELHHGDLLLAAITSCTNTSNLTVMVAAGLLARNATSLGLNVPKHVKTSMAPGSRVVTALLEKAKLLASLEKLGFAVVAYGCTTCIGNSGPLPASIETFVADNDIVACSVLSGNRNFEGRIHASIRANYLASPPLVVAFALAGRMDIDLTTQPVAHSPTGKPVYLRELWPSDEEIDRVIRSMVSPEMFLDAYTLTAEKVGPWADIKAPEGDIYQWPESHYIVRPPFFDDFDTEPPKRAPLAGARALGIFGHSLTTDHISPAGSIPSASAAGTYLQSLGITQHDFNGYGARRGNHEVMIRGTFAHARIKNLVVPRRADGSFQEGGYTVLQPTRSVTSIFDAAMAYHESGTPAFVFGGQEYGTGSARDWAAKGTKLLHVAAVIVSSFERIHRLNLVLMGVMPLEFAEGHSAESLGLTGNETFDLLGLESLSPRQAALLNIRYEDGRTASAPLVLRLDTPIEVSYYLHGGITPYVLRQMFSRQQR